MRWIFIILHNIIVFSAIVENRSMYFYCHILYLNMFRMKSHNALEFTLAKHAF